MQQTISIDKLKYVLSQVKRPSRYIGGEWGAISKQKTNSATMCLAFPDLYEVGMSYLGFQILYSLINSLPYATAERVYAPWVDAEEVIRKESLPLWSLETKTPLKNFDAIGFTLQYELSYTNILTILSLAKIAFHSEERADDDPIIVAGGVGALYPAPLESFIDVFLLGDGEVTLPKLMKVLQEMKGQGRDAKLTAIAKIDGAYVPHYSTLPVTRTIVENLEEEFTPNTMIVPNTSIVHDRVAIQVFKGCTRGCRFCQAGIIDRPVRERNSKSVLEQIKNLLTYTGWDEVGLLSLATCDWSCLKETLNELSEYLAQEKARLSLPSLRVDAFSVDMAATLEKLRKGGLTFAPEAGTQRLRNVINKGVTDKDINDALNSTFEHGWERVKLYFMMGLPTETDEDLEGVIEICNRAYSIAKQHKRRGDINVSVAGFVPKPHTPFQWEKQATIEELWEKGRRIKHNIRNRHISLSYHEPEQTFLEGVFARGDKKLSDVLECVWNMGERFDGWTEHFNFVNWQEAFNKVGIEPMDYTGERKLSDILPWDYINIGVTKDFLLREREKAYKEETTQDCRQGCNACGWQAICKK